MTIKQVLLKYKWAIIVSVVIVLTFPFFLNWLVLQHTTCEVAGKPETWIAFWPSYLSAIASFGMIAMTAIAFCHLTIVTIDDYVVVDWNELIGQT